jgi:hypothetical protein
MKNLLILLTFLAANAVAQPPVRILEGSSAPSAGSCNASTLQGALYIRYGDPSMTPNQVYACTQLPGSTYAWQYISHKTGSSLPASCDVGEVFFNSGSSAGSNWFGCTASNTWTLMSGGSGGTPAGSNGDIQRNNSTAFGAANINQNADGSLNASKAVTYPGPSTPMFNSGGTTTCDWSASNVCAFTMTGNTTLAFSNPHGSGPYIIRPTMDGTGGRVITYPVSVIVAPQPSTTLSVVSHIMCFFDGSSSYYCFSAGTTDAGGSLVLPGSTSGALTVKPAAIAGTNTLTFPAGTTDLSGTGGTSQVLKQTSSGGAITVARLACADLSDSGTSCTSAGTVTIASGTSALGTSSIGSGSCATVVTTTATGAASTDTIVVNPNASIKAVTGYAPSASGGLGITGYPTTNAVNWDVCNWSSGSITPGAITLNWRVVR